MAAQSIPPDRLGKLLPGWAGRRPTHTAAGPQPTYTEDHALQGVLRLAEQPPADLRGQAVEVTCTVHSAAPE